MIKLKKVNNKFYLVNNKNIPVGTYGFTIHMFYSSRPHLLYITDRCIISKQYECLTTFVITLSGVLL